MREKRQAGINASWMPPSARETQEKATFRGTEKSIKPIIRKNKSRTCVRLFCLLRLPRIAQRECYSAPYCPENERDGEKYLPACWAGLNLLRFRKNLFGVIHDLLLCD